MQEKIYTEDDYRKAVMRFLEICDAQPFTKEYEEALLLTQYMEEYEKMSRYERRHLN
jgi:hypothetical protein